MRTLPWEARPSQLDGHLGGWVGEVGGEQPLNFCMDDNDNSCWGNMHAIALWHAMLPSFTFLREANAKWGLSEACEFDGQIEHKEDTATAGWR